MIKPLPGYVLIKPIDEELKQGAVYLPEQSKDKPMRGKIVALNLPEKVTLDVLGEYDVTMKEGDVVIYKKWTNQEVVDNDITYLLVHFTELLATEK